MQYLLDQSDYSLESEVDNIDTRKVTKRIPLEVLGNSSRPTLRGHLKSFFKSYKSESKDSFQGIFSSDEPWDDVESDHGMEEAMDMFLK